MDRVQRDRRPSWLRQLSAHSELAAIEQRITKAKAAARAAQLELERARRDEEAARDAVRESHDLSQNAAGPTKALQKAKATVEEKQLAQEGVGRRVQRAERDKVAFVEANAGRLMEELAPQCEEAVAAMQQAAEDLIAADSRWFALQAEVSQLLTAQHRAPRDHAPADHQWALVLRELRRAPSEVRSPLPYDARIHAAVA